MKINLNTKLKTLDGRPIKNQIEGKSDADLDLKIVCTTALLGNYNENIDGNEKAKRYQLALDIQKSSDSIDLKSEEITLLKELIGKAFATLIVGQSYDLIDPIKKN